MDPHSRFSQFNQRQPKSGPRAMPLQGASISNPHAGPSSTAEFNEKRASKSKSKTSNTLMRRPIASNSRIRQGESLRRDMYLAFVNNALQEKAQGTSGPFDELVNQFNFKSSPATAPSQLRSWISALSHVVSRLERTHAALVEAIVNMPWTLLDSPTVKQYTVFMGMLLSARPEYLSLVMGKIVHGFTHQSSIQVLSLTSALPSTSTSPPTKPLTRRTIYDRLHYLLAHILSLIPTLPSTLQPFLIKHFPHKRQNQFAQLTYIRNILRVSTYCPELSDKILATIVDRAIQIDVEIQVELEELEDEESDNGLGDHDLFELDPFDVLVGQEGNAFDSDEEDAIDDGLSDDEEGFSDISSDAGDIDLDKEHVELPTNVKHVQGMVKKLDGILTLLFEHFKKGLGGAGSPEAAKSVTSLNELRSPSPLNLPPLPTPSSQSLYSPLLSLATLPMPSSPTPTPTPPLPTPTLTIPTPLPTLDHTRTQFNSLLSIFDRTILNTFKSRYTQFLVFWYASLDPEFADIFQGMLVERALYGPSDAASAPTSNPSSTPELTSRAAASYIGSFVSRAKFVDKASARRVVGVLCEFLQACLDDVDEALRAYTESGGNLGAAVGAPSQVFYAVAQAVLLIFCFRWRDLRIEEEEDEEEGQQKRQQRGGEGLPESISAAGKARKDEWIPELNVLKRVVMSVLNPLKVCSPGVVMQFARVAHHTGFLYCFSILESNKRNSPSANSSSSSHVVPSSNSMAGSSSTVSTSHLLLHPTFLRGELNNELNTFFPFDPYRLPRSGNFIQEVYREWSDVAIDGGEDDDEDEDDDNSDSENEGDSSDDGGDDVSVGSNGYLAIPGRQKRESDDGGLGASLVAMSISPGVKASKISESLGSTMAMSISCSHHS